MLSRWCAFWVTPAPRGAVGPPTVGVGKWKVGKAQPEDLQRLFCAAWNHLLPGQALPATRGGKTGLGSAPLPHSAHGCWEPVFCPKLFHIPHFPPPVSSFVCLSDFLSIHPDQVKAAYEILPAFSHCLRPTE